MKLDVKYDGQFYPVGLVHSAEGHKIQFAGTEYAAELRPVDGPLFHLDLDGRTHDVWLAAKDDAVFVHALGQRWELELLAPLDRAASERSELDSTVRAPMPGMVVKVHVKEGDEVRGGQPLLVIESMKLHTVIAATAPGLVETVHVTDGGVFDKGSPLVTMRDIEGS